MYIRKNVDEIRSKTIARWHKTEAYEREASSLGYYISRKRKGISMIFGKVPKKYAARFYQLKVGQRAVGKYLAKIEAIKIPQDW